MTKSANFIPNKSTHSAHVYSRIYIDEIVRLLEIPFPIISDRGS